MPNSNLRAEFTMHAYMLDENRYVHMLQLSVCYRCISFNLIHAFDRALLFHLAASRCRCCLLSGTLISLSCKAKQLAPYARSNLSELVIVLILLSKSSGNGHGMDWDRSEAMACRRDPDDFLKINDKLLFIKSIPTAQ
jgi:hypothetical protein